LQTPSLLSVQPVVRQICLNKSIALYLVHPLKLDSPSHAFPLDITNLITSFADVFVAPIGLTPICSIDLIPGVNFPNAPSYHLVPREVEEVECQLQQLLNTKHIQPSSSTCASPSFIIPKKDFEE
jgi:hypothetical protein